MADSLLSKEQAKKVLLKNQENIVKKAADGKVLTTSEQEILFKIAEEEVAPVKVLTAQQLATELGISRRTVFHLRKLHDGPEGTDVEEWKEYLEMRAAENVDGLHDDHLPEELQKTRHQLLRAQAGKEEALRRLKEIELEKEEKGLVPLGDAQMAVKRILSPLRALLDAFPKANAHAANPANPIQAETAMEEGMTKVFEMLEKELSEED
ncbi:MAG: hypothetical protein CMI54_08950 [Parcubacteria group bacterium]|jgi:predicted transcriptional regulator YheO|nr:hypothetical protein [Parcubacteria group bacterium]|tara:strand:+ start:2451 stop:3077 length:627 start_codon:yes stop_codon:yes gene_type:complete